MALDTRNKRSSAIGLTLPWRCQLPLPDGTIDQADRQHISWIYSGILAGEAEPPVGPSTFSSSFVYDRDVDLALKYSAIVEVSAVYAVSIDVPMKYTQE